MVNKNDSFFFKFSLKNMENRKQEIENNLDIKRYRIKKDWEAVYYDDGGV